MKNLQSQNQRASQVVGPHQPIVALVDNDIILPCHMEPGEDVTAEILEWTRSDLTPRFVHVWRAGQDLVNTRNPSYRGRTSLFINELKNGNISLKLSRVKLSDEGTYQCHVPLMDKKAFVKLVVDAPTSPVISLSGIDSNRRGVVLQCESAGWYPEPELLWLDAEGNLLSAGPTETLRGPDDLYTVSSRVTVEKRHSNNITCRVQQKNINQSRETHIHVPGETQLIGPKQPIIAAAGEDVTLPCHLVQVENVATKTLEWTRPDLDPRFVFVWRAGQDFVNVKNPAYKGRSSLFTDELKHGNISLKLSKVKPADEGRYRCYLPDKNEEVFIDLIVGAVSSPIINLEGLDGDKVGVLLVCKSEGWHPKPEVRWLDCEGNLLPAGPTETLRGPDDLYSVSSRVTVVEKRCGNNFTCRVEQKNINQSRETHIQIPAVKREHGNESEKQERMNRSKNDQTETDREQEKLMTQDIVPVDRLMAEVEKLKEEKQQLQHLLDAKEQKHKPLFLEKNQEADNNLKDTEELNQQLEKKDAEIRELKKQLDKNQEADKKMKEENEKLREELERKSSRDKDTVKQLVKLKETEELNQQLKKKDAEITELKKQLDKNQEGERKMKEEIGKLKFQLERKSSRDKNTVKQLRRPATRNPNTDNDDLIWMDLENWSHEDNQKISLISNTGEEHRLK
ncbi:butyrophilin-like protein 2 [Archocentrus centrarchus]|uniref:butyrophilin-like protein 2 n=1 Tax=Archocentrus centrarchus TaxID=63155 RepID=UPI0011EA406D|nr:butyrophilin-like protein 2 [Archocentrus centrarchus]